jgi:diguanylate cyclase (GGDEF)-like protein
VNTLRDRRLLFIAHDVAQSSSMTDACVCAAAHLSELVDRPCWIRAFDGKRWNVIAGATPAPEDAAPSVRVPLETIDDVPRELLIGGASGDETDPSLSQAIGMAIADALQHVALRTEAAAVKIREVRLDGFSRALVTATDSSTLHGVIVEHMARAVRAEMGSLAVLVPVEETLAVVATYGYPSVVVEDVRLAPGEGVLGRVFSTARPILTRTASENPGATRRRRYRTDSYVALPLVTADGVIAVVALTDKADSTPFDDEDLATLTALGVPAALALAREQLRDRTHDLAHLATVDGLTGLFNRRYFETRLEQEIQRQRRQADELALLMVDLDNFKDLNDSQGHLVGDRVLREVADILRRAVRIFDVCARYGGEEFVILMPGAGAPTALRIAERIRRQVEQHFASGLRSGQPMPTTVSVGVSTASPTTSRETLIAQADSALLWAKTSGKNLVNLYPALTTP